jgi:hypothetical protein
LDLLLEHDVEDPDVVKRVEPIPVNIWPSDDQAMVFIPSPDAINIDPFHDIFDPDRPNTLVSVPVHVNPFFEYEMVL